MAERISQTSYYRNIIGIKVRNLQKPLHPCFNIQIKGKGKLFSRSLEADGRLMPRLLQWQEGLARAHQQEQENNEDSTVA